MKESEAINAYIRSKGLSVTRGAQEILHVKLSKHKGVYPFKKPDIALQFFATLRRRYAWQIHEKKMEVQLAPPSTIYVSSPDQFTHDMVARMYYNQFLKLDEAPRTFGETWNKYVEKTMTPQTAAERIIGVDAAVRFNPDVDDPSIKRLKAISDRPLPLSFGQKRAAPSEGLEIISGPLPLKEQAELERSVMQKGNRFIDRREQQKEAEKKRRFGVRD